MIDSWIPATTRLLEDLARNGVSGTGTWRDRTNAATVAIGMMSSDPQGPTMPVVIPLPLHRNGPEGLRPQLAFSDDIRFDYVNWRGERGIRNAAPPYSIRYGTSEYHGEPQYLLSAMDRDKGQMREYALRDMTPIT